MEIEKSENGQPIYRYDHIEKAAFTPAHGDTDSIEAISNHIEKYIGKIEMVFHEIVSDKVHIDVFWIKPTEKFPFNTFITSGMSDMPMNVPDGYEMYQHAELCILLPEDWEINEEAFNDENNYWPVRWLKLIARLPHDYNNWVGYGHTIPNGENAEPLSEQTKLGCLMLLSCYTFGEQFEQLHINPEKSINFYSLVPIYKEEMEFKLKKGTNELLKKFDKNGISDIIDLNRKNTCLKKGLFGLW
jgi:hypothetical protein